jgi:hypothetical protein
MPAQTVHKICLHLLVEVNRFVINNVFVNY